MELTGAEIVVKCLPAEGVEYVFGYPGGAVLFIYDELFKQDKVKHFLVAQAVRHTLRTATALRATGSAWALVTFGTRRGTTRYRDRPLRTWIRFDGGSHRASAHPAIGLDCIQECDTVGFTRPA